MGFDSRLRLRFAAVAACAFASVLVSAQSWANDDRDDERCAGNQALRLVNGRIHTMDAKDRIVSSVSSSSRTPPGGVASACGSLSEPSGKGNPRRR